MRVDRALCGVPLHTVHDITIYATDIICNFGEAQAESSLIMAYVNRNVSERLLWF